MIQFLAFLLCTVVGGLCGLGVSELAGTDPTVSLAVGALIGALLWLFAKLGWLEGVAEVLGEAFGLIFRIFD